MGLAPSVVNSLCATVRSLRQRIEHLEGKTKGEPISLYDALGKPGVCEHLVMSQSLEYHGNAMDEEKREVKKDEDADQLLPEQEMAQVEEDKTRKTVAWTKECEQKTADEEVTLETVLESPKHVAFDTKVLVWNPACAMEREQKMASEKDDAGRRTADRVLKWALKGKQRKASTRATGSDSAVGGHGRQEAWGPDAGQADDDAVAPMLDWSVSGVPWDRCQSPSCWALAEYCRDWDQRTGWSRWSLMDCLREAREARERRGRRDIAGGALRASDGASGEDDSSSSYASEFDDEYWGDVAEEWIARGPFRLH